MNFSTSHCLRFNLQKMVHHRLPTTLADPTPIVLSRMWATAAAIIRSASTKLSLPTWTLLRPDVKARSVSVVGRQLTIAYAKLVDVLGGKGNQSLPLKQQLAPLLQRSLLQPWVRVAVNDTRFSWKIIVVMMLGFYICKCSHNISPPNML